MVGIEGLSFDGDGFCALELGDEEGARLVLGEEIAHGETTGMAERKFEAFMESLLGCRGFLEGGEVPAAPAEHQAAAGDWLRRC